MSDDACPECGFEARSAGGLKVHMNAKHDDGDGGFPGLEEGSRGPQVAALQAVLALHGGAVNITGIYDAETARGVRAAQANVGVEATGEVDDATWRALLGFDD